MALFLILILVAAVLGFIGAVAGGLGYLLAIAIVLFVATVARCCPALVRGKWTRKAAPDL
ncbi:hypothetical protein AB0451_39665 [Streptomyces sp. NPDC052000]|uniref:hypothetical protein n=1 Tax=Streptomyces sp. NPDC052000 TaxID=3155676 RepID=UPI00344F363C